MHPKQFDDLRECLLRSGVAPRHVRRYIRELREHYADIVRVELGNGSSLALAEQSARARLGSDDDLARSVLAQPELRSIAARFPRLVFGAGPALLWVAIVIVTLFGIHVVPEPLSRASQDASWVLPSAYALCVAYVRVLPVVLGFTMLTLCIRQRSNLRWTFIGDGLVSLLGGTVSISVVSVPASAASTQLGVSSALLPLIFPFSSALGPVDTAALSAGVGRAAFMLAITWLPYTAWRCSRWLQVETANE